MCERWQCSVVQRSCQSDSPTFAWRILFLLPRTHESCAASDYQRLEFLGDAVLGWLVTAHLYFASSDFTPAELTRIKASRQ